MRTGAYDQEVDRFSLLSIATALRCLAVGGRSLWERYDTGDNLLFRQADLQAPAESPLFQELLAIGDPQANQLVSELHGACQGPLDAVPLLTDLLPEEKPAAPAPSRGKATTTRTSAANAFQDIESEPKTRLRRLQGKYAKIADAVKTLAGKAEDAEANLTMGKFECFDKEDWKKGLPMLAQGSDPTLAELARTDEANPEKAVAQAQLGPQWWEWSEKQSDAAAKSAAHHRAQRWYREALPSLNGWGGPAAKARKSFLPANRT